MDYDVEHHSHSGQNDGLPDHISSEVTRILDAIRRTVRSNPEEARPAALRLVTLLAQPVNGETPSARGGLAPWQKRKIERHVRENIDGPLPVDKLARQLSLSASHFTRAFRETFAVPPHTYIVRSRLEMAQQLMLSTGDALSQIALACGFADQSHFSKAFRRGVGESPNAWRRRNLTEAQAQVIGRIAIGAR
jgi:AraC family transcriptional regulator